MTKPRPTKRERTRRKLLDAGMHVIAERGEALTASDVVVAADVSNGTFYNHFVDRDEFITALAHESLAALTERSADDTEGADPAWRFAVASVRVLHASVRDPLWGRAVLRLVESPTPLHAAVQRHLRSDLADGHRTGRFTHGDDPVTVDLVSGTLMAALRRLVSTDSPTDTTSNSAVDASGGGFVVDVVARLLETVGVEAPEARSLATAAAEPELQRTGVEDGAAPAKS
jgi:AcrR family transcriptional regulator